MKLIKVRYNIPDDEWHSAYFETDPAADGFTHHLEDKGIEYEYVGHVEVSD